MKAMTFAAFGGPDVLQLSEVAKPTPAHDEVLIKLTHTSVNPVDWKIREGHIQSLLPHRLPAIPGWDAAGIVVARGVGVQGVEIGDEVFAYARKPEVRDGTYAEYIALPAHFVARKPRSLRLAEAAAVPLVALTAWQGLSEIAKPGKHDTILITGAAGGVGSFAVQFAKARGATVIATASAENHAYLRELGADHTIDYRSVDFVEAVRALAPDGIAALFDAVGGDTLTRAMRLLKDDGRVVSIVDAPAPQGSLTAAFHFVYPSGAQLAEIAALLDDGKVQIPHIRLASVRDAVQEQIESARGHGRGKVVLTIDFD